MAERQIPYQERDITQDPEARKELMRERIMGVPAFRVNGQYVVGLDPDGLQEALNHQVFPCPGCGRKLRAPAGKGRLKITCPDCGHQFVQE